MMPAVGICYDWAHHHFVGCPGNRQVMSLAARLVIGIIAVALAVAAIGCGARGGMTVINEYIRDFDHRGDCPTCRFPIVGSHVTSTTPMFMIVGAKAARTCDCGPAELERAEFEPDHTFFIHMRCWACDRIVKRKVTGATLGPLVDPGTRCHV